jgi:hypothetical protein
VCLPLWYSGQSSWPQIQRPGFGSRGYQILWEVVGLERGPLSLVSTIEELLKRKVAAPVYKSENTDVEIRHADHVAPSISKRWHQLLRQVAVARSVIRSRTQTTEFVCLLLYAWFSSRQVSRSSFEAKGESVCCVIWPLSAECVSVDILIAEIWAPRIELSLYGFHWIDSVGK